MSWVNGDEYCQLPVIVQNGFIEWTLNDTLEKWGIEKGSCNNRQYNNDCTVNITIKTISALRILTYWSLFPLMIVSLEIQVVGIDL